jgi:hypothetical protein
MQLASGYSLVVSHLAASCIWWCLRTYPAQGPGVASFKQVQKKVRKLVLKTYNKHKVSNGAAGPGSARAGPYEDATMLQ